MTGDRGGGGGADGADGEGGGAGGASGEGGGGGGRGRVVVVTGGAGAIGTAVRERFAAAGDRPVGLDRRKGVGIIATDVSSEAEVAAAFAEIRSSHGRPTVLVHAAGVTGAGTVLDEAPDAWRRILDVNLTSAYLCAREVIPDMRAAGGGRIVFVASVTGRFGGSKLSGPAYAVSKGGLLTLARFLAREHADDDIQVNAVAPGPHDTPMWDALDADNRARMLAMIPGGKGPFSPADLAAAVEFLCSPEARSITGATLDVNGGQWMG